MAKAARTPAHTSIPLASWSLFVTPDVSCGSPPCHRGDQAGNGSFALLGYGGACDARCLSMVGWRHLLSLLNRLRSRFLRERPIVTRAHLQRTSWHPTYPVVAPGTTSDLG